MNDARFVFPLSRCRRESRNVTISPSPPSPEAGAGLVFALGVVATNHTHYPCSSELPRLEGREQKLREEIERPRCAEV